MKENATIYDIAKQLGISAATVSRALNNNPKISQKTRDLVFKTAKELNYQKNYFALALTSGQSKNIALIVPFIDRNFFSSVIRGVEEELYPKGYQTIICQTHEDEVKEKQLFNSLLNNNVDGILISISRDTKNFDHYQKALKKKIPVIFFDRKEDIEGVSAVTIDDYKGGYTATKHLIEQGYQRILHLSGDASLEIYKQRHQGYLDALKEAHLDSYQEHISLSGTNLEQGKLVAKQLLQREELPDGIFCSGDYLALGVIQEFKAHGVQIPEQLGVVGFGNEPFTELLELSISSIDQSPELMGRTTAKLLLEQLSNPSKETAKRIVLDTRLYKRKSSLK